MTLPVVIDSLPRDDPLVTEVAVLRWNEWGTEEGSSAVSAWEAVTRSECGSDRPDEHGLPFTLVAKAVDGAVLGAVGLVQHDPEGLSDRSPWVVGTVVRPDVRASGVGAALMAELHRRATRLEMLWVSTQKAASFYARCGYEPLAGHTAILYRKAGRTA